MNADELELKAKEARKMADIAKHKPVANLTEFGLDLCRETAVAQCPLMNIATDLQVAYANELQKMWTVIATLRHEALYWKQKCEMTSVSE